MAETMLNFMGDMTLAEAATNEPPKFSMRAYTGAVANVRGFEYPIVVDLSGVSIKAQRIPIRRDHKEWAAVGHSTAITIENGEITACGIISRDTEYSRDIVHSGKLGFPWQASIGGPVHKTRFLAAGQKGKVNGMDVEGPLHIVQKMTLKEISFVEYGADPNTSASVEAIAISGPESLFLSGNTFNHKENLMAIENETKTNEPATITQSGEPQVSLAPAPTPVAATPNVLMTASDEMHTAVQQFRKAMADERERINLIASLGRGAMPELEAKAVADGWSAQQFELAMLRQSRPAAPAPASAQMMQSEVLEAVALAASGCSTASMEKFFDTKTLDLSDKYRGMGLQEFCELAASTQLPRFKRDAHGWLQAAFSTTSLPGILSNVANKMLLDGYNYVEDSWRQVVKFASVTDFKQHKRYRLTGSFKFEPVGPQGELKHGMIGEMAYSQQANTHGIMFSLTRQMIIDDDMGALTDIPRQVGMGAGEAIADAVWELLLSNPTGADGNAFYSTAHKNFLAGATTELGIDSLTAAEILFGSQTKPTVAADNKKRERPLGIMPSILLVPIAQKVMAEMLMKSQTINETTPQGLAKPNTNPHAGKYSVVSSTYLSSTAFAGSSDKAWYLFADPNRLPSLEVAFLGGQDRPTVERADADFNTLGVQFRGYIDFGVKEQDWRGSLKVKGAT